MLQQDSAGNWHTDDGLYPVFLHHGSVVETPEGGRLRRFSFVLQPTDDPQIVETDTDYAYLTADIAEHFFARKWARTLTQDEADALQKADDSNASADSLPPPKKANASAKVK